MRSDIAYGDGMYKSTDGGTSWTHVGLTEYQADRRNRRRSARCKRRVRSGARSSVRSEHRTRRLQNDRRRQELDEGSLQRARRRRDGTRDGARRSERHLRRALADATPALERLSAIERPRQRSLQDDRRRARLGRNSPTVFPHTSGASDFRFQTPHRIAFTQTSIARRVDGGVYRSDDAGASWTHMDGEAANLAARLVLQRHHRRPA